MLLPGRKEGKVSLLVGGRGKPQKSGERCCSGGVPLAAAAAQNAGAAVEEGRVLGGPPVHRPCRVSH